MKEDRAVFLIAKVIQAYGVDRMETMLEMLKYIQSFSNNALDTFFELVTMLGEEHFFIIIMAIIYWCFNKSLGYKLAFVCLTGLTVNTIIKEIVKFSRPIGYEGIKSIRVKTAEGYSFPSAHTQQSASFFTILMMYFRKKWLYFTGISAMLLVGLSRMYLGVHWPSDVLGGLIIGILWVLAAGRIFDWSKEKGNPWLLGVLVIPMFTGLLFFKTAAYYKIVATLITFWIGYIIENKYINFLTKAIWWKQIIKLATGISGLVLIKESYEKLLPPSIYSDLLGFALMGIWMTIVSPVIFRVLHIEERI